MRAPSASRELANPRHQRVFVEPAELRLVHVGDVEHGLGGEQEQLPGARLLLVAQGHAARRPPRLQRRLEPVVDGQVRPRLFSGLARRLGLLGAAVALLFQRLEVLERKLGVHHLLVAERVDRAHPRGPRPDRQSSAARAPPHPPRGCCRGTGCRAPRPSRLPSPGRRCRRTPARRGWSSSAGTARRAGRGARRAPGPRPRWGPWWRRDSWRRARRRPRAR